MIKFPKSSGVYMITSDSTGRYYIGSTVNLRRRINDHLKALKDGTHHSAKFQHHYTKYPLDTYTVSILNICSRDLALELEQMYIDVRKPYFNVATNVKQPTLNISHTPEVKERIRATAYETFKRDNYEVFASVISLASQYSVSDIAERLSLHPSKVYRILHNKGYMVTKLRSSFTMSDSLKKCTSTEIQQRSTASKFLAKFGSDANFLQELELVLQLVASGVSKLQAVRHSIIPIDVLYCRSHYTLSKPLLSRYGITKENT